MGLKSQFQVKMKQREKRKKARQRLQKQNKDPKEFFYSGFYIGPSKTSSGS